MTFDIFTSLTGAIIFSLACMGLGLSTLKRLIPLVAIILKLLLSERTENYGIRF